MNKKIEPPATPGLAKSPTGITGPDEITGGGLPTGRPTLICCSAGWRAQAMRVAHAADERATTERRRRDHQRVLDLRTSAA
jgi:hypothetical protein